MRIVRISVQGKIKYGVLEDDVIRGFRGNPFPAREVVAASLCLTEVAINLVK